MELVVEMNKIQYKRQPSVLLVANVGKEHVLKFHVPTIKKLIDDGWHVDVACSGEDSIPYCNNHFKMSYKRSPFNFALFKGIKELTCIVEEGCYDVVYCHTPVGGVAARIASRKARKNGTKVVYMAHGYHFFKGASITNWLIYYTIEKILSWMTDSIVLINNEDYLLTKKRFGNCKAYLIDGIGVDEKRFHVKNKKEIREQYREQMNIPPKANVLIYLAELLPNKNQTFLMRVLKRVLERHRDTYLVLAGFDHSNGEFEEYAKQIGIEKHVRFLGWREDVGNLYAMADICTATSIREGFGLNLVEAMFCEIPVIATVNRGHVTIIRDGENGFLVEIDDEELFAERIVQLIEEKEIRQRFVENGNVVKGKYDSNQVVLNIKKILEEHLSKDVL